MLTSTYEARLVRASAFLGQVAHLRPTFGPPVALGIAGLRSVAYRACGPVLLESAEGDRPMSIVWTLKAPLPVRLFREFSVLRGV